MSTIEPELREELQRIAADPALFCKGFFDLRPTRYQTAFLRDTSKRIVLRWNRQSGKSTFRSIWIGMSRSLTDHRSTWVTQ